MATKAQPSTQEVDFSTADPFIIPTRDANNLVPSDVVSYEVVSVSFDNTTSSNQTYTLQEYDSTGTTVVRSRDIVVGAGQGFSEGFDSERGVFEIRSGYVFRIAGDGTSTGQVQIASVK